MKNTYANTKNRDVAPKSRVQAHVAGMIRVEHLQHGILETNLWLKFVKIGPRKENNYKIHHGAISAFRNIQARNVIPRIDGYFPSQECQQAIKQLFPGSHIGIIFDRFQIDQFQGLALKITEKQNAKRVLILAVNSPGNDPKSQGC